MKKLLLFIIAMCMVFSAFANGGRESASGDDKIVIAGMVFQNDSYMKTLQIGMQAAADQAGVTLLLGNSDNKVDKEAQLIDTYIARGIDGLIAMPISADSGSDAVMKRVAEAGIKFIYVNTTANVPGESYIGTSNLSIGQAGGKVARAFIEKNFSGEEVQVATVSFRSQLPELAEQRSGGFFSQISDLPGVSLVAEQDAWLAEMAIRVVGDILTANPNIRIIHAANEGGTVGAVQAVRNAGLEGKVFVFGTDGSDQIVQMLLAGDNVLQSSVAQLPFEVGKATVEVLLKTIKGESVQSDIDIPPKVLSRDDPSGLNAFQEDLKSYQ